MTDQELLRKVALKYNLGSWGIEQIELQWAEKERQKKEEEKTDGYKRMERIGNWVIMLSRLFYLLVILSLVIGVIFSAGIIQIPTEYHIEWVSSAIDFAEILTAIIAIPTIIVSMLLILIAKAINSVPDKITGADRIFIGKIFVKILMDFSSRKTAISLLIGLMWGFILYSFGSFKSAVAIVLASCFANYMFYSLVKMTEKRILSLARDTPEE